MRVAIIDCGTNTFHLLIADASEGKFRFILRRKMAVKLASNRLKPDVINDKAFERAVNIMMHYRNLIKLYDPDVLLTAGTAALRDAGNGRKLVKEIARTSGIRINVISGDEEAGLISEGVLAAVDPGEESHLIMDIGGGSTEFIICRRKRILWKRSFQLGAARLIQEIKPSDPLSGADIRRFSEFLEEELQPLIRAAEKYAPKRLTGASGSFDTFASLILHKKGKPNFLKGKTHYTFNVREYLALHEKLLKSNYAERLKMPGMLNMRADMIVTASLLLTFVLHSCNIRQLELSTYALKEGLLVRHLRKKNLWPKS